MMRGDATGAIAKLDDHRRLHPTGPLTELREALYVEALARAGRAADAHAQAIEFFAKYPNSLLGPAIEDALGRISDD
jgi:outer membrane protein assembly factor BamD (BamD/ComL family)